MSKWAKKFNSLLIIGECRFPLCGEVAYFNSSSINSYPRSPFGFISWTSVVGYAFVLTASAGLATFILSILRNGAEAQVGLSAIQFIAVFMINYFALLRLHNNTMKKSPAASCGVPVGADSPIPFLQNPTVFGVNLNHEWLISKKAVIGKVG